MLLKFLLPFLLLTSLYAEHIDRRSLAEIKLELGLYAPDTGGDIENTAGSSSFENDHGYSDLKASYFAIDTVFHYDYVPNVRVSYFTMNDNQNSDVNTTVANEAFLGTVSTTLDYSVLSAVIYQDFKVKGDHATLFSKPYYTGDIEFDIGLNLKMIEWKFAIKNATQDAWIKASELIALPYIGFKYYLYDFIAYADASALAVGDAESSAYSAGIEYQVVEDLYLGVGYLYEHFEVVEQGDTVTFDTSGYKVSFKYVF